MITMKEYQGRSDALTGRYLQRCRYCLPQAEGTDSLLLCPPHCIPEPFRGDRFLSSDRCWEQPTR